MKTVLVIGGGAAGLAAARNLQLQGCKVEIIDPLPSPGGASFGNGGFISPQSFMPGAQPGMLRNVPRWLLDPLGPLAINPAHLPQALPWFLRWICAGRPARMAQLARAIHRLHAPALSEWQRLLGPGLFARYIRQTGEALLWDTPPAGAAYRHEERLRQEFGIEVEELGRTELQDLYPGISPAVTYGIIKRDNAFTVSPAAMMSELAGLMAREGAVFHRESAAKLIPLDGGWLVLTSTGNHRAQDVVVACGVWSTRLTAPLGIKVPMESQRGYHVMLPGNAVKLDVPFIHRNRGIGMTPMQEGLRVAGTVEFSGIDGVPDERRAGQALSHARSLFPALTQDPVAIWSGQRPATPDTLPVLGEAPSHPGLWLCFGHGPYGMTSAPASGRIIAELMLKTRPFTDPEPYRATRF